MAKYGLAVRAACSRSASDFPAVNSVRNAENPKYDFSVSPAFGAYATVPIALKCSMPGNRSVTRKQGSI
jgi:hypothetical protein